MDDAKQQLIDRLQSANNILVTVSRNPSVDQLASCLGLTLLLNKQGKHAAAVFSGKVPSTIEFLQPDETIEKNTDSLRDFIISLDKAKADKLRYKVEEDVVRIFITPYKTSLSEADLEFSEGDFNVDVVVALGVQKQEDLDQAITAHGRILHDATVTSINTSPEGGLGTINWHDPQASSLSEQVTDLAQALNPDLLDAQIATALLTGIVSETGRFSNDKTSPLTMSASAALMAAGANQQLVANKLEESNKQVQAPEPVIPDEVKVSDDGLLEIEHIDGEEKKAGPPEQPEQPEPAAAPGQPPMVQPPAGPPAEPESTMTQGPKIMTEAPKLGGQLTANSESEHLDPVTDPFSMPASEPPQLLDHKDDTSQSAAVTAPPADTAPPPAQPPATPVQEDKPAGTTLTDIERSVHSPHITPGGNLDNMRNEVDKALSGSDSNEPIEALNAQPFGGDLHQQVSAPPLSPASDAPAPSAPAPTDQPKDDDPNSPPPVPPPIPFQFGNSPPPQ